MSPTFNLSVMADLVSAISMTTNVGVTTNCRYKIGHYGCIRRGAPSGQVRVRSGMMCVNGHLRRLRVT